MKNTPLSGRRREAQLSAVLADVPKADDHDGVREYLHALAQLGCAPLLIYPGSKQPADMRSPQRQSADDKAAQQAARDAGKRNWQRVKSDAGVHLATSDVATLDGYLDRYIATFGDAVQINAALSLGRSRLVVVDCDSVQQRAAFLADAGADAHIAQTVSTPGHVGDGDPNDPDSWAHSNGGHFWFVVPDDVELPQRPESMSVGDGDDAYSVMWGPGKYALIPPSVRDEGTYTVSGDVHALPDWLGARIIEHGQSHAERAQRSREHIDNDSPIARWGATISWAEILRATGWTPNGKADSCGCETWTAPGPHASAKSATAHEPGCAQWVDSSDPPMHIWTDHDIEPFDALGCATVSRLQAVTLIDFDNDMGAAMTALDLHDDSDSLALDDDLDPDIGRTAQQNDDDDSRFAGVPDDVRARARQLWVDREARKLLTAHDAAEITLPPVTSLRELLSQPDEPVRMRIDSLWAMGGGKTLCAASAGAGKTTLNCNLIRSLADDDAPFLGKFEVHQRAERIVLIDNEMTATMLRSWLRRQGVRNIDAVVDVVNLRGQAGLFNLGNDRLRDMWTRRLSDLGCDFVIFDCLSPVVNAMGLKEATELGKFLHPLTEMLTSAGVEDALVQHHMGHEAERARGDSTALGWSDNNWNIVKDGDAPDAPRYFFASKVRDADDPAGEGLLSFDKASGRLTYVGGDRAETVKNETVEKRLSAVLDVLAEHHTKKLKDDKGMGTTEIKSAVGGDKGITDRALDLAKKRGQVTLHADGRAKRYKIAPEAMDPMHMGNDDEPNGVGDNE
ncbi:AAA family ATPase [Mycobacterium avium subsp. hominissuis]|uniref:AAA family ATPase n=1 Tax=Mycobacterium avium TaxID=1764 RepID=UPI0011409B88|nr:AAA family ATPase [Mycobacterium avium]